MATIIIIFIITFLHSLLLSVAAQSPSPPPSQKLGCVAELVAFSPCLSYVSDPPNNATNSVPPQCCVAFSSAFDSGDGYCFCYILRQPLIFGFPLNETRVSSLSSFCTAKNDSTLDLLCSSDIPALPPLARTTESGRSNPSNSGSYTDSSASIYSPPEPAVRSPTPPSSSAGQFSATNKIYKHSTGMIIFLLNYIHF